MNKPDIKQVLHLMQMKKDAVALYEKIDATVAEIMQEFGPGRFDYDLDQLGDDAGLFDESLMSDGRYLKLEIVDNAQALKDGTAVWKSVQFSPVSFKVQSLKRCPESLK